eukprot:211128-Chlamydomonas_euryale.AAC.2
MPCTARATPTLCDGVRMHTHTQAGRSCGSPRGAGLLGGAETFCGVWRSLLPQHVPMARELGLKNTRKTIRRARWHGVRWGEAQLRVGSLKRAGRPFMDG